MRVWIVRATYWNWNSTADGRSHIAYVASSKEKAEEWIKEHEEEDKDCDPNRLTPRITWIGTSYYIETPEGILVDHTF